MQTAPRRLGKMDGRAGLTPSGFRGAPAHDACRYISQIFEVYFDMLNILHKNMKNIQ
ncbi:hypothetical protein D3C72_2336380 [compost metagenome]